MTKRMSIHLPSHVQEKVEELAARARISQAEVIRWSVLTFAEAVNNDLEIGYIPLFRESEMMKGQDNG